MEAFCSPSQLREMEFYTQCVRTQWEVRNQLGAGCYHTIFKHVAFTHDDRCVPQDVRAEISDFLQQLSFEVTRKHFNAAALQCELHIRSWLENQTQVVKAGEEPGVGASVFSHFDFTDLV